MESDSNNAPQTPSQVAQKKPLSVFILAMINVAAICSIKNWPQAAQYGFSSLFYYIFAALGFFIPSALVSAELASGWPKQGGVFAWVKEALGHRMGFLAIWLQWVENMAWYPTTISFIAASLAYSFNKHLSYSTTYTFIMILVIFWGATLLNFRGMKVSGWFSTAAVFMGTIIPGILIIILGILWIYSGKPIEIVMNWDTFFPSFDDFQHIALLAGVILGFAGMEMSAAHAKDVANPRKGFPKAIFLSTTIILALSILGTLAISFVIPQGNISLVSGTMEALSYFLESYQLGWLIPVVSILLAIGALGAVVTWIIGPSRGLLAAAMDGELPPFMHKVNKSNMPVSTLIVQGIIVTFLSCVFLFMPDVSSSFWLLVVLTSLLYNLMYILMFISGIVLRYRQPDAPRPYKIPGGKIGMWIVAGIGTLVSLGVLVIGFIPPAQLILGNIFYYELFLILGVVLFVAVPFIILLFKNPNWNLDKQRLEQENKELEEPPSS